MNENPEEDFATLFAASLQATRLQNGQTVQGTIVAIGADVAFVNVGGKGEATLALAELADESGVVTAAVGDRIEATVVSTTGGITLSRRLQRGAATAQQLAEAFRSGLPVEGKVEQQIKGGYQVGIARQRAFCPQSQIDTAREIDPAVHVGRVYPFRIIEYSGDGRKFVVSRRALLEQEQQARADQVRRELTEGVVVTGRVVSVRDFGAFVDLGGGVQGLLHVSEMGWSRVANPSAVVAPGQDITAKVVRVDAATGQIALSRRPLLIDPWSAVSATFAVGQVRPGRITRLADFGAFVELEEGIEGLAHASSFAPTGRPGGWTKTVHIGMTGDFEVLSIDIEKRRIGLAPVEEGSAKTGAASPRPAISVGARLTGKVERHEPFGTFVFLAPGVVGLVPASESGLAVNADARKAFPVGSDLTVVVLEIDTAGRRVRLSVKAVAEAVEAADVREYAAREAAAQSQSFGGSLADKLRGALKPKG